MDKIRTELYKIDMKNTDEILKFYKKHKTYYENLNKAIDKMTIEEFIVVKQNYCVALEKLKQCSDALIVLEQVYRLLERLKNKSSEYYYDFYEKTLFWEGLVLGRQKKYEESNERFKKLIVIDPKNKIYQDWYLTNKEWMFNKKHDFWEYLLLFIMIIAALFGKQIFGKYLLYFDLPLLLILVCWLIWFIYRKIIRYREKQNK
jgi:tetratricopeptide (TPR) repeat protein